MGRFDRIEYIAPNKVLDMFLYRDTIFFTHICKEHVRSYSELNYNIHDERRMSTLMFLNCSLTSSFQKVETNCLALEQQAGLSDRLPTNEMKLTN